MSLRSRLRAFVRSAAIEALDAQRRETSHVGVDAVNLGRTLAILNESRDLTHLSEYGFQVFSQFGEDGIIQRLISKVQPSNDRFVEIGVEDYSQSNTRFLALKDNWRGLIIDADEAADDFLRRTGLHNIRAIEFRRSFITAENVDDLLRDQPEDLGLLSIDIDGMDYWIWKAITVVRPSIVVVEYNNTFGGEEALVVPYQSDFDRMRGSNSGYYGASLAAFEDLGKSKGYALVGISDGPNAFFVLEDSLGSLGPVTASECYREARYRDSEDAPGPIAERRRLIENGEVLDLRSGGIRKIGAWAS